MLHFIFPCLRAQLAHNIEAGGLGARVAEASPVEFWFERGSRQGFPCCSFVSIYRQNASFCDTERGWGWSVPSGRGVKI